MTRRPPISDVELDDCIRRSMNHYRMRGPLVDAPRSHSPSWLRLTLLVMAVVAGVAVFLTAISILQLSGGPVLPGGRGALDLCQPHQQLGHIPDEWLEAGESRATIRDRLGSLPLVAREEDRGLTIYLFSDGRFGSACLTVGGGEGSLGPFVHEVRTMHLNLDGELVSYAGGTSDPEGPVTAAGAAGQDVEHVKVTRADGVRVDATMARGVWLAWWPDRVSGTSVEAFDAAGRPLGRQDAGIRVSPPAPPVSDQTARDDCLQEIDVPEEWRLPGEDFDAAQARIRALPLLIVDHGTHRSSFLFGDELYGVQCTFDRLTDGRGSSAGPNDTEGEAVSVIGGRSNPAWAVPESVVSGTCAPHVAQVIIDLADGSQVDARIEGGYWLASWQRDSGARIVRAYDAEGNLVGDVPVRSGR